jgi:hypothetical protein
MNTSSRIETIGRNKMFPIIGWKVSLMLFKLDIRPDEGNGSRIAYWLNRNSTGIRKEVPMIILSTTQNVPYRKSISSSKSRLATRPTLIINGATAARLGP